MSVTDGTVEFEGFELDELCALIGKTIGRTTSKTIVARWRPKHSRLMRRDKSHTGSIIKTFLPPEAAAIAGA